MPRDCYGRQEMIGNTYTGDLHPGKYGPVFVTKRLKSLCKTNTYVESLTLWRKGIRR